MMPSKDIPFETFIGISTEIVGKPESLEGEGEIMFQKITLSERYNYHCTDYMD